MKRNNSKLITNGFSHLQKDADQIANTFSEDPDQTAPGFALFAQTSVGKHRIMMIYDLLHEKTYLLQM